MFSVVDVIGAITDSDRARKHWSDIKRQMLETEGFDELSANIGQLPLKAADGKMRMSDVAFA
jgi:hypothetical protein